MNPEPKPYATFRLQKEKEKDYKLLELLKESHLKKTSILPNKCSTLFLRKSWVHTRVRPCTRVYDSGSIYAWTQTLTQNFEVYAPEPEPIAASSFVEQNIFSLKKTKVVSPWPSHRLMKWLLWHESQPLSMGEWQPWFANCPSHPARESENPINLVPSYLERKLGRHGWLHAYERDCNDGLIDWFQHPSDSCVLTQGELLSSKSQRRMNMINHLFSQSYRK